MAPDRSLDNSMIGDCVQAKARVEEDPFHFPLDLRWGGGAVKRIDHRLGRIRAPTGKLRIWGFQIRNEPRHPGPPKVIAKTARVKYRLPSTCI
jgi:hypothetical protein